MDKEFTEALGIDLGGKRVGIARVSAVARLPEPVTTLDNDEKLVDEVRALSNELESDLVVLGLPRNLSGDDTEQTLYSRRFADTLNAAGFKVALQDEALTSRHADELINQGVYRRNLRGEKVTTDEVAACLILQDYIGEAR